MADSRCYKAKPDRRRANCPAGPKRFLGLPGILAALGVVCRYGSGNGFHFFTGGATGLVH